MGQEALSREGLGRIEAVAVEAARSAGALLLEHFATGEGVSFKDKREQDPVTEADREAERLVRQAVAEAFPEHAVVGEENVERRGSTGSPRAEQKNSPSGTEVGEQPSAPRHTAEFVWVVDPLDGTANFAGGLPLFAVSIGVLRRGRPVVGAVWASMGHRVTAGVYHGSEGRGVWFEGERLPLNEERQVKLAGSVSAELRPAARKANKAGLLLDTRSLGSVALEMALVASGALRVATFRAPRAWDVAAGIALVHEAGGTVVAKGKDGVWRALEGFDDVGDEALRRWSKPVVAGRRELVEALTRKQQPHIGPIPLPGFLR